MLMPAVLRNGIATIRRRHRLSILSGLLLIIGLFSLLQLVSIGVISQTMTQVRQDISANESLRQQQAVMDKARMEVMNASDKLNRAGIYLLVDKETGSEGSWHSLMDEAEVSLKQAQAHYQLLGTATTNEADTPAFVDLKKVTTSFIPGLSSWPRESKPPIRSIFSLLSRFRPTKAILLKSIRTICKIPMHYKSSMANNSYPLSIVRKPFLSRC